MKAFQRSFGAIVKINFQLLGAAFNGVIAYLIWPTDIRWWGLGVVSILCGGAAFGFFIDALRGMIALYMRDRTLAAYQKHAKPQKSADMASEDALVDAGVIDA